MGDRSIFWLVLAAAASGFLMGALTFSEAWPILASFLVFIATAAGCGWVRQRIARRRTRYGADW